jgi:hypothetical protein
LHHALHHDRPTETHVHALWLALPADHGHVQILIPAGWRFPNRTLLDLSTREIHSWFARPRPRPRLLWVQLLNWHPIREFVEELETGLMPAVRDRFRALKDRCFFVEHDLQFRDLLKLPLREVYVRERSLFVDVMSQRRLRRTCIISEDTSWYFWDVRPGYEQETFIAREHHLNRMWVEMAGKGYHVVGVCTYHESHLHDMPPHLHEGALASHPLHLRPLPHGGWESARVPRR